MSDTEVLEQIEEIWRNQKPKATIEQQEEIVKLYISLVLGLGDEIAEGFAKGVNNAYQAVGMANSAICTKIDISTFWERIDQMFPGDYSRPILTILKGEGPIGVLEYLFVFMNGGGTAPLMHDLRVNMHVYK